MPSEIDLDAVVRRGCPDDRQRLLALAEAEEAEEAGRGGHRLTPAMTGELTVSIVALKGAETGLTFPAMSSACAVMA